MAEITPEWFRLLPYGYAPGGYMNRCISCGNIVSELDKRATRCRPCAVSAADNAALQGELESLQESFGQQLAKVYKLTERVKVLEDALRGLVGEIDSAPNFARSHIHQWFPRSIKAARAALGEP